MMPDHYYFIILFAAVFIFAVGYRVGQMNAPQPDCPPPDPQPVKLLNLTMSEDGRRITYEFEGVESIFALNKNETAWVNITPSVQDDGQEQTAVV